MLKLIIDMLHRADERELKIIYQFVRSLLD